MKGIHYETGKPVHIETHDGIITAVDESTEITSEGLPYIAPGLIDNQVNGYGGIDFSAPTLTVEDVRKVVVALRAHGVTTLFPTLITNSDAIILRNCRVLAEAMRDPDFGAGIPGLHVEGPYISPVDGYRGCHPLEHVRKPSWDEFRRYLDAAEGRITQVTLAPETEGAMDFIEHCVEHGVKVALGHTAASSDVIAEAVQRGARFSTHLGNACPEILPRHQNPVWAQLSQELLIPSIIVDGHHLPVDVVRVIYATKGSARIHLTSDVVHLAGMPPGDYDFAGAQVKLLPDGKIINPSTRMLAGASRTLLSGVENMMRFTGCAVADAVRMASTNLAASYGLDDRGSLEVGKRADVITFDLERERITLRQVKFGGRDR